MDVALLYLKSPLFLLVEDSFLMEKRPDNETMVSWLQSSRENWERNSNLQPDVKNRNVSDHLEISG